MTFNTPTWLERFEFDRFDWGPFELRLDFDRLDASLDRMCEAITEELRARRSLPKGHPLNEGSRQWLKSVCYNAILTCMYYGVLDELVERQERLGRVGRGPRAAQRSIFDDALKGIFAHERPVRGKELLDRKDRERLAEEIWWGFRHYIEPSELVAFNHDHPFHRDENTDREMTAPSLDWKIVKRRFRFGYLYADCVDLEEDYRGRYPDLQERVDRLATRYLACVRRRRLRLGEQTLRDTDEEPHTAKNVVGDGWDEDD